MNALYNAPSPYLRAHANQPVDWLPYGEEAFQKAKRENKPLFISIGYATCHWCHVMAKESFSNEAVAAVLNQHFVPVKVDRESDPEVDRFYMDACVLMTGEGGWPLNVVTDPEGKPFFATTYMPPTPRFGRRGIIEILEALHTRFEENPDDLYTIGNKVLHALKADTLDGESHFDQEGFNQCTASLLKDVDTQNGGFGHAPKFPTPHRLFHLYWASFEQPENEAITKALHHAMDAMAQGGLFDHLGGGFFRYATDSRWVLPHFEKMLVDNAVLAKLYYLVSTEEPRYKDVADKTLAFIETHLKDDATALYYSAMDADSDGGEGAYYIFTAEELETLPAPLKEKMDDWALNVPILEGKALVRDQRSLPLAPKSAEDEALFEHLKALQKAHPLPLVDRKLLLTENALMLSLWATRAKLFARQKDREEALSLADAIEAHFLLDDGTYAHSLFEDTPYARATLTDLASLAIAYLDLYDATFSFSALEKARTLLLFIADHYGPSNGGFSESLAGESPLMREHLSDGAAESGTARLLEAVLRLIRFFDDDEKLGLLAEQLLARLEKLPHLKQQAYLGLWNAALYGIAPPTAFLVMDEKSSLLVDARKRLARPQHPRESVFYLQKNDLAKAKLYSEAARNVKEDETSVRLCRNGYCSLPARRFPE